MLHSGGKSHWGLPLVQESPAKHHLIDRLGFGCVALTSFASQRRAERLLALVHDLGIRHFDTAPIYGQGYSERLLGNFLRRRSEPISVATKFGMRPQRAPTLPLNAALALNALRRRLPSRPTKRLTNLPSPSVPAPQPSIDRQDIEQAFDSSRRALGRDFIDIYLLHESVPASLTPGAFAYLQALLERGSIGRIGVAAGAGHYATLGNEDLEGWEVLQYEAGPAWPASAKILQRFPTKTHIFHSCLKGVERRGSHEDAGQILRRQLEANPLGFVLFSSSKPEHIRANVAALSG